MPNSKRGEIDIQIDGETHGMRFTMGAVRELQEHFKADSLQDTFQNGEKWGARDIVTVIHVGLKRGSGPDITIEDLEEKLLLSEMSQYMEVIKKGLSLSGGDSGERGNATPSPSGGTGDAS